MSSIHLIFEIGITTSHGQERVESGSPLFFASQISDDKHEAPTGLRYYGTTPVELAKKLRDGISEIAEGAFTWEMREVPVEKLSFYIKRMNYRQFNIEFMNALNFPQNDSE